MSAESLLYSVAKAISWRLFGTLITLSIVYLLTQEISTSVYIGALELIAKSFLFIFMNDYGLGLGQVV